MTMTFFDAAAASSSGLILMIDGPVEAAASFSESVGGACAVFVSPAAGAATSGVVTTTSAGMRNGLSRSEIAPAVAIRQSAASPVPSDLASNRRWRGGRPAPFRFCPRGRSISLGRGNLVHAFSPYPSEVRIRKLPEPRRFRQRLKTRKAVRARMPDRRKRYWLRTALSGFGGKAGSVFWPRSSS